VAAILTNLKLDDATIVAALLHDTIEDTRIHPRRDRSDVRPEIGALVEGLTKLKRLELVSREAKQAENLRKLLLAISDDVRVLLVKLADRLHNMRTMEFMPAASRRRIAEETLDIYAPLPVAWVCRRCGRSLRICHSRSSIRMLMQLSCSALMRSKRAIATLSGRSRRNWRQAREERHQCARQGPPQAAVFDLDEDGAQVRRF
jgi:hypothetical protein